jgi:hypothetical protein
VELISFLALIKSTPLRFVAWYSRIAWYRFVRNSTGSERHASSIVIFFFGGQEKIRSGEKRCLVGCLVCY